MPFAVTCVASISHLPTIPADRVVLDQRRTVSRLAAGNTIADRHGPGKRYAISPVWLHGTGPPSCRPWNGSTRRRPSTRPSGLPLSVSVSQASTRSRTATGLPCASPRIVLGQAGGQADGVEAVSAGNRQPGCHGPGSARHPPTAMPWECSAAVPSAGAAHQPEVLRASLDPADPSLRTAPQAQRSRPCVPMTAAPDHPPSADREGYAVRRVRIPCAGRIVSESASPDGADTDRVRALKANRERAIPPPSGRRGSRSWPHSAARDRRAGSPRCAPARGRGPVGSRRQR